MNHKRKNLLDELNKLAPSEAEKLINQYAKSKNKSVPKSLVITYTHDIEKHLDTVTVSCPYCQSTNIIKKGKIQHGLQRYQCKSCCKKFTKLTNTILEKSPWSWNVWTKVLYEMLHFSSVDLIMNTLINEHYVVEITRPTVLMMVQKLRELFVYVPKPELHGVIQMDEMFFHESQKGIDNPTDVLKSGKRRKGRRRSEPSKYGTMGNEFGTVLCAVDEVGHATAKHVCMGHIELDDIYLNIHPYLKNVTFICTDMNPIYTQYTSMESLPHYVIHSQYHKNKAKCKNEKALIRAYENDLLDYVEGAGILTYKQMNKLKKEKHLTINGVNGFHSELRRYIDNIERGVSTKFLDNWCSFISYVHNYKIDNGHTPSSLDEVESILKEFLNLNIPVRIKNIKQKENAVRKQTAKYTKKLIETTVASRVKSNNPYLKFNEEDGVQNFDKRYFVMHIPEYKRRKLAKILGIKPFSSTAFSSKELKKKLLKHPKLKEGILELIGLK